MLPNSPISQLKFLLQFNPTEMRHQILQAVAVNKSGTGRFGGKVGVEQVHHVNIEIALKPKQVVLGSMEDLDHFWICENMVD